MLFPKYHEEGINISLLSELITIRKCINLEGVELDESNGYADVQAEDSDAKKNKIRGVPYFPIECGSRVMTANGVQKSKEWCA